MATKKKVPEKKVEKNSEFYLLVDYEQGRHFVLASITEMIDEVLSWAMDLQELRKDIEEGTIELFKIDGKMKKAKSIHVPQVNLTCEFYEEN